MSLATPSLFGGLAQGIFGRMREHEDEQRKTDLDEKKTALTSLSSLLEHATPETRPTIYNQMAEVMKLKGKHRGVWDMLTGGGRDDYHNQLSTQLDGVFGNVVGPEKYEQLKQQGVKQDMGAAFQANDPRVRSSQSLPQEGKVALRDPIAEHLTSLRTQYGIQNDRRSAEIELRAKLQGENQAADDARNAVNRKDIENQKSLLRAFSPIMQRAQAIAGNLNPDEESIDKAAQEHATKMGLDIEKLRETIPGLKARARRDNAQAQYYESGGAASADKPITPYQAVQIDKDQQAKAGTIYEKWSKIKATLDSMGKEQEALRAQLKAMNPLWGTPDPASPFQFDEAQGTFYDPKTKTGPKIVNPSVTKMIQKLRDLEAQKSGLMQEMRGHRSTLESQFPSLYTFGDEWSVTPNAQTGGVAPAGAPRTGTPPPFPAGTATPLAGVTQYTSSSPLPKGTIIDTKRGKFKVTGLGKRTAEGYIHDITPVKE